MNSSPGGTAEGGSRSRRLVAEYVRAMQRQQEELDAVSFMSTKTPDVSSVLEVATTPSATPRIEAGAPEDVSPCKQEVPQVPRGPVEVPPSLVLRWEDIRSKYETSVHGEEMGSMMALGVSTDTIYEAQVWESINHSLAQHGLRPLFSGDVSVGTLDAKQLKMVAELVEVLFEEYAAKCESAGRLAASLESRDALIEIVEAKYQTAQSALTELRKAKESMERRLDALMASHASAMLRARQVAKDLSVANKVHMQASAQAQTAAVREQRKAVAILQQSEEMQRRGEELCRSLMGSSPRMKTRKGGGAVDSRLADLAAYCGALRLQNSSPRATSPSRCTRCMRQVAAKTDSASLVEACEVILDSMEEALLLHPNPEVSDLMVQAVQSSSPAEAYETVALVLSTLTAILPALHRFTNAVCSGLQALRDTLLEHWGIPLSGCSQPFYPATVPRVLEGWVEELRGRTLSGGGGRSAGGGRGH